MKERKAYPPNYAAIKAALPLGTSKPFFAYGSILYNPHKLEIPEDVWIHEATHQAQQQLFTSPDLWWQQYLLDKQFRQSQELEAFAAQYAFIKRLMPRAAKDALFEYAENLSSPMYGLGLTHLKAESMIRLRASAQ
jgi:hypothetical protein